MNRLIAELEKGHGTMLAKGGPGSGRHASGFSAASLSDSAERASASAGNSSSGHHLAESAHADAADAHRAEGNKEKAEVHDAKSHYHSNKGNALSEVGKSDIIDRAVEHNFILPETAEWLRNEKVTALDAAAREARVLHLTNDTDHAAHAAATSPINLRDQPTDGQKDAGNYKKGHVTISGLNIAIENPQGSTRKSHADVNPPWESTIKDAHYGYLKGVVGQDKDHLDVFLKPSTPADFAGSVYVIHQDDQKTGDFDEHKVMLGYASEAEATAAYKANYPKDWKVGLVQTMSMPEFKTWTARGSVVQRTWGSNRPVAFQQPAPFLSKGGPGSGPHPGGVHHPTDAVAAQHKANADEKSSAANKASAQAKSANTKESHASAYRAHMAAGVAHSRAGNEAKAQQHRATAGEHLGAAANIRKDVTTGTGLSTPQAGLTHYDRGAKKVLREEDSDEAFQHNVAVEISAGKSQEQAVAIAYATQREAKKRKTQ